MSEQTKNRPAQNDEEFLALVKTDPAEVKIIRSRADWDNSLTSPADGSVSRHPLGRLSPAELDDFTENLVFNPDGGLAGAKVGDLADRLSYNEFRELWGMFGMSDRMIISDETMLPNFGGENLTGGTDHRGCKCVSHGNCDCQPLWATMICTANC